MLWKKWQLAKGLRDLAKSASSDSGGAAVAVKEEREQATRKETIRKYRSR